MHWTIILLHRCTEYLGNYQKFFTLNYPDSDALMHALHNTCSCCLRCAVSNVKALVSAKALYQSAQKEFLSFLMGASAARCAPGSRARPAVRCFHVTVSVGCNVTSVPASLVTQESVSVSANYFNNQMLSKLSAL